MKKRFLTVATIALLACTMLSTNASASTNGGSCNGNCGPWIISCSGETYSEVRTHSFDYKGYRKTCEYRYIHAYTDKECEYCHQKERRVWSHSHGYRDHAAECEWINSPEGTCFLR